MRPPTKGHCIAPPIGDHKSREEVLNAIFLALPLYGFAGWIWVAGVAPAQPQTLSLQLTYFAGWPDRHLPPGELPDLFLAFIAYRSTCEPPSGS